MPGIKLALVAMCSIWVLAKAQAQLFPRPNYYPPIDGGEWSSGDGTVAVCPNAAIQLDSFMRSTSGTAFLLSYKGYLLMENYYNRQEPFAYRYWASAGKSVLSVLAHMLEDEGKLDLSAPVADYLGLDWTNCLLEEEPRITVRHLLTMSSGLNDQVTDQNCRTPECLTCRAAPDTRWAYHQGPYLISHDVLEAASGETLNQLTKRLLHDRIGMDGLWVTVNGDPTYFGTARSFMRFGLFAAGLGYWEDEYLIAPDRFLDDMWAPEQSMNEAYGRLWWLNGQRSFMLPQVQIRFPGAMVPGGDSHERYALGRNGQILRVSSEDTLVFLRMGEEPNASNPAVSVELTRWFSAWAQNCLCFNSVSQTSDFSAANEAIVFPNPARDRISVPVSFSGGKAELYLMDGKAIYSTALTANALNASGQATTKLEIALPELKPGMYLLRLCKGSGECSRSRLLIQP